MDKKQFRRARIAVRMDMIGGPHYGYSVHVPGYKAALRLHLNTRPDCLAARLSPFTPDARSRIRLYPLMA